MSPAQLAPADGLKSLTGTPSVAQPELLAAKLPYPPIPVVEIVVWVVAGMAGEVSVAGIAVVLVMVMAS
jgi:hypothetical protein